MDDELVNRLSKRIADLRAEAGEEFCNCESYDKCYGECCGIGNCTCTSAATPDGPRTWALPDEPGPEVTAVRDEGGRLWYRERRGWTYQNFAFPWVQLLRDLGPLTDATPAADGQDGDGRDG